MYNTHTIFYFNGISSLIFLLESEFSGFMEGAKTRFTLLHRHGIFVLFLSSLLLPLRPGRPSLTFSVPRGGFRCAYLAICRAILR